MKNVRHLWLFLIAGLSGLWAAEPVTRTFRVVSVGLGQAEFLYDNGREKGLHISSYQEAFSSSFAAPSGGVLALYRMVDPPANAPAGAKPTKEVLAEIAYPHDAVKTIVLLYPSLNKATLPILGQVLDDSVGDHKPGMARIINLSSRQIAFTTADTAEGMVFVQPRSLQVLVPFAPGSCRLRMAVEAGGWKEAMDTQRNLPSSLRLFVVVADAPPSEEGGPVACTLFNEYVRPPMTFVKQDRRPPAP